MKAIRHREMARPLVELLFVEGSLHEGARILVKRVSRELGIEPKLSTCARKHDRATLIGVRLIVVGRR
jgi:hypothetical protein